MREHFFLFAALIWWTVLFVSFNVDRSRYRNCLFLFLALANTVPAVCDLAGKYLYRAFTICVMIIIIAILLVPVFLIADGILMIRREGHSLSNLLALLLGLIIGIGELATFVVFIGPLMTGNEYRLAAMLSRVTLPAAVVSVSVIYGSVAFLIFVLYSVFLMIIPRQRDFDYVIIHGAGLLHGDKVSKLLADRLDKAIEIYRIDPTPPYMIPSGGQGSDETVPEAQAMAQYLRWHDIPDEKIVLEDRSRTTFENLRFSKDIIDRMGGRRYIALVTSNYHVYRALRYCRKIGLKCVGIGSHTALYYWPSALIREWVAIHAERKHLLMFITGWVLCMAIVFYPYL